METGVAAIGRTLLYAQEYTNLGNGSAIVPLDECFCRAWLKSKGSDVEMVTANVLQWSAFGFCVLLLMFYAYQTWRATCGWEEVYVCVIELVKVIIEFFHEFDEPAMLMLASGARVQWLRYAEWLMTCPVILIHLSNLTGLADDYNKRTMGLLVSDIGTIVWGATSAMSTGYVKVIFFILGCLYGANTFFHAAKVYIESYHTVPKGTCRNLVRIMAWVFFLSWGMFPILFVLGPEGFGHLTVYGSTIGHTIIDVLSKNVWGLLGHKLREKIHEHIVTHGDIRKKTKIKIAGTEIEVETLVAEEDEETVKKGTGGYASRESFLVIRDKLKDKGVDVRASLENSKMEGMNGNGMMMGGGNGMNYGMMGGGGGAKPGLELAPMSSALSPGRVILAVPDISMVDFFREQFALLPVPYELVPSLGVDNTCQLVQQAASLGGCDFILMHPEFLRDRSNGGLPAKLKMMGQRTAAFGWAHVGPVRDLIESSSLDGWLEGPSFGTGVSQAALVALIGRMQAARKMTAMGLMGGMGGGMGGMGGGMGGMGGISGMNGSMGSGMVANVMTNNGMGGGSIGGANAMMLQQQQMMMMNGGSMSPAGVANSSGRVGTNPLFNQAPSPLGSQPGADPSMAGMGMGGGMGGGGMGGRLGSMNGVTPAAGGGGTEAEMLQNLMNEINRLKRELGE